MANVKLFPPKPGFTAPLFAEYSDQKGLPTCTLDTPFGLMSLIVHEGARVYGHCPTIVQINGVKIGVRVESSINRHSEAVDVSSYYSTRVAQIPTERTWEHSGAWFFDPDGGRYVGVRGDEWRASESAQKVIKDLLFPIFDEWCSKNYELFAVANLAMTNWRISQVQERINKKQADLNEKNTKLLLAASAAARGDMTDEQRRWLEDNMR